MYFRNSHEIAGPILCSVPCTAWLNGGPLFKMFEWLYSLDVDRGVLLLRHSRWKWRASIQIKNKQKTTTEIDLFTKRLATSHQHLFTIDSHLPLTIMKWSMIERQAHRSACAHFAIKIKINIKRDGWARNGWRRDRSRTHKKRVFGSGHKRQSNETTTSANKKKPRAQFDWQCVSAKQYPKTLNDQHKFFFFFFFFIIRCFLFNRPEINMRMKWCDGGARPYRASHKQFSSEPI